MDRPDHMARRPVGASTTLEHRGRIIEYHSLGDGPRIVLHASAGREASDFNELVVRLAEAGYRALAIEAPGIGRSALPDADMTLFDMADDLALMLGDDGAGEDEPVTVIGHAFGNRVVRAFSSRFPERVRAVILVAAGGAKPIPDRARSSLNACFDRQISDAERTEHIRYAFFAAGNDIPDHWLRGWHGATARLQGLTQQNTDSQNWWTAGEAPILVVQAAQDTIAPPEDTSELLQAALGARVSVTLIESAGHALLPEAPTEISESILEYLSKLHFAP